MELLNTVTAREARELASEKREREAESGKYQVQGGSTQRSMPELWGARLRWRDVVRRAALEDRECALEGGGELMEISTFLVGVDSELSLLSVFAQEINVEIKLLYNVRGFTSW